MGRIFRIILYEKSRVSRGERAENAIRDTAYSSAYYSRYRFYRIPRLSIIISPVDYLLCLLIIPIVASLSVFYIPARVLVFCSSSHILIAFNRSAFRTLLLEIYDVWIGQLTLTMNYRPILFHLMEITVKKERYLKKTHKFSTMRANLLNYRAGTKNRFLSGSTVTKGK